MTMAQKHFPGVKKSLIAAISAATLVAAGCSSDNDDNSPRTGVFLDSAVQGLTYTTATRSGTTNADGEFQYLPGETVVFSIGDLEFPPVSAAATITPLDIANAETPFEPVANNIARLLQTLDSDNNPDNGITIPDGTASAATGLTVTDFSDTAAFETEVAAIAPTLISADQAAQHVFETLQDINNQAGLTLIGRHVPADRELDESLAEIVAYHAASESILVINANSNTVDRLDASSLTSTELESPLSANNIPLIERVNVANDVDTGVEIFAARAIAGSFTSGGINSVAVAGDWMAVAVQSDNDQANGAIAFYQFVQTEGAYNINFVDVVDAGALPDNVQLTSDAAYAIAANEGEPSDDYTVDPEGSITIVPIDPSTGPGAPIQVNFQAFNAGGSETLDSAVRVSQPRTETTVAKDLEPEYVAISDDNTKAYVSMQENNAIAVIDIATGTVDNIFGLGEKDHSIAGNGLDPSNRDECTQEDIAAQDCTTLNNGININTFPALTGFYMPDSIVSFAASGTNYVVTANEGDAREYFYDATEEECTADTLAVDFDSEDGCLAYIDEVRVKDLGDFNLSLDTSVYPASLNIDEDDQLGRLKVVLNEAQADSDEQGVVSNLTAFGARSFSIFNADTGALVFDSGDDFEQITAQALGTTGFNTTDNENDFDDRSDDKGPEPEALAIGEVDGTRYAFIGLERTGGIMMYDISNPSAPEFVQYVSNRDYTIDIENDLDNAGDLAPEGMKFVPASDSPTGTALLIVGNEVSGTTSVYSVD